MKKNGVPLLYKPKALIPGERIEPDLEGLYVGVPDRGYKGKKFIIRFAYPKISDTGEKVYVLIEKMVEDWNRADRFRRFMDQWGRGAYTLGYFRVADLL